MFMGSCDKIQTKLNKKTMDLNKEIRETIAFYCGGTYENRKLAADKILQIWNKKQLPINGVVTGLLCVDDTNCDYITLGDTYKLIEESETLYTILDNDGDEIKYDKNNFTKIYK